VTTLSADWYLSARERCHALALELVRMDRLAESFELAGAYPKADQVRFDRDELRHERSRLLREIWRRRRITAPRRRARVG